MWKARFKSAMTATAAMAVLLHTMAMTHFPALDAQALAHFDVTPSITLAKSDIAPLCQAHIAHQAHSAFLVR